MTIASTDDITTFLGKSSLTSAETTLLMLVQPLAEAAVKDYVGYSVESASYTHFLPQDSLFHVENETVDVVNNRVSIGGSSDTNILRLPEIPVTVITGVNEDAAAYAGQGSSDFSGSNLTAGTDYYLDVTASGLSWTGHLVRIGGTWPARQGTVKVVYTAGLSVSQLAGRYAAIRRAAIIATVALFKESVAQGSSTIAVGSGALSAESVTTSGHSVTYDGSSTAQIVGMKASLPFEAQLLLNPFKRFRR